VQIEIGIGYGADIEAVRRIIRDAVRKVEGVLPDKPVDALFLEFGEPVMIFRVRWWIDSYIDTRRMFDSVNEALYEALAAAGIDMPFTDDDVSIKFNDQDLDRLTKMA
jgi:small-conductance mechanosensitive channel